MGLTPGERERAVLGPDPGICLVNGLPGDSDDLLWLGTKAGALHSPLPPIHHMWSGSSPIREGGQNLKSQVFHGPPGLQGAASGCLGGAGSGVAGMEGQVCLLLTCPHEHECGATCVTLGMWTRVYVVVTPGHCVTAGVRKGCVFVDLTVWMCVQVGWLRPEAMLYGVTGAVCM